MQQKTCGIYQILNLVNNKSYIGQSLYIERRWQSHRQTSTNSNSAQYEYPLYRAMRKYGIESFAFKILEQCSPERLNEREQFYMDLYGSITPNGYNQVNSGQGGTMLKPPEVLEIIQELQSNNQDNTETIGAKFGISGRTVRAINTGEAWYDASLTYPIRLPYTKIGISPMKARCIICNSELKDKRGVYCRNCYNNVIKQGRPSREELKKLIRTLPFTQIGEKYHVTDNAVRKWYVRYNLPSKKKNINQYTDEQWMTI